MVPNTLTPQHPNTLRRGSTLMFAVLVLAVVAIMGAALAARATSAARLTRAQQHASIAFNLAESGAEDGLRYLRDQAAPPAVVSPFDPFNGPVAFGDGTYRVTID